MSFHIMERKIFAHCTCGRLHGSKTPTPSRQKASVTTRETGQKFETTPLPLFVEVINELPLNKKTF